MVAAGRWRALLAASLVVPALLLGSTAPATALSPPPCNEATGIAATDNGTWVLSSWDHVEVRDGDWERTNRTDSPGENNTYGVAHGPNGSLWLLQSGSVVNVSEDLDTGKRVDVDVGSGGVMLPDGNDLAYDGRWLVLFDGDLTSYNASWDDRDPNPPVEEVLPANTRGLYVTGQTYAFLTADGTLEVYERIVNESAQLENDSEDSDDGAPTETVDPSEERDNGTDDDSFVHRDTVSLDVAPDAVDVHPGPNGTLLVLHPGNVTVLTSDGERIEKRVSVFAPDGCDVDTSDAGETFAYLALLVVGGALAVVVALVVATVLVATVLRQ